MQVQILISLLLDVDRCVVAEVDVDVGVCGRCAWQASYDRILILQTGRLVVGYREVHQVGIRRLTRVSGYVEVVRVCVSLNKIDSLGSR